MRNKNYSQFQMANVHHLKKVAPNIIEAYFTFFFSRKHELHIWAPTLNSHFNKEKSGALIVTLQVCWLATQKERTQLKGMLQASKQTAVP